MSVEDYFKEYKVIRLTGYKDVKVDNFYTAGISAVGINSDSFILIWPGYCGTQMTASGVRLTMARQSSRVISVFAPV